MPSRTLSTIGLVSTVIFLSRTSLGQAPAGNAPPGAADDDYEVPAATNDQKTDPSSTSERGPGAESTAAPNLSDEELTASSVPSHAPVDSRRQPAMRMPESLQQNTGPTRGDSKPTASDATPVGDGHQ